MCFAAGSFDFSAVSPVLIVESQSFTYIALTIFGESNRPGATMAASKSKPKASSKSKSSARPKKAAAERKATNSKKKDSPKPASRILSSKSNKAKPKVRTAPAKKSSAKNSSRAATNKVVTTRGAEQSVVKPVRRHVAGVKPLAREFLHDLSRTVRDAVRPAIAAAKGREIVGTAPSGDATFELDRIAEKALLNFLKRAHAPVAYYSEEAGYTTFSSGQPKNLLVVDPIDGTRAAKSGFEGCTVSVCSTRIIERPTFGDVDSALVMEILGNRTFYAERDNGARMYVDGHARKVRLSGNTDLEKVIWAMTVPARPAELIFPVAAKMIDLTSLKGGFFACNSTSYSLTRLVSGQLDACVDFANRFYRDIRSVVEDSFINAGRGIVLGVCPYDFAGALLIAQEAGCTVTDAYGKGFDEVLLLDSSISNHRSIIAASNAELHQQLFEFFDARIKQYEKLLAGRK